MTAEHALSSFRQVVQGSACSRTNAPSYTAHLVIATVLAVVIVMMAIRRRAEAKSQGTPFSGWWIFWAVFLSLYAIGVIGNRVDCDCRRQ